jgi:hypothetical protein
MTKLDDRIVASDTNRYRTIRLANTLEDLLMFMIYMVDYLIRQLAKVVPAYASTTYLPLGLQSMDATTPYSVSINTMLSKQACLLATI